MRIGLVVDSVCDLPAAWREAWDIPMIPAYVHFGDQSYADDGIAISRTEFYRRMAESHTLPTTSAPSVGEAKTIIQRRLETCDHALIVTLSANFSSINRVIALAAQEVDPARTTVYDSGSLSMGVGWQVFKAVEALRNGADLVGALAALQSARNRVKVWATADSLEYLRRGGRVSALMAGLGTLLQIKPIIEMKEGAVQTVGRARTMGKARQAFADLVRSVAPLEKLAVLHAANPEGAAEMLALLSDVLPTDSPDSAVILDVATAIGTHFGPGALGIGLLRKATADEGR